MTIPHTFQPPNHRLRSMAVIVLGALLAATAPMTVVAAPARAPEASAQGTAEEQNKALVLPLYTDLLNQGNTDLASGLFSRYMIQHDPRGGAGGSGQLALFDSLKATTPGLVATVKHVAADGDLVAVHWHASATPDDEFSGQAVVDVWRVASGTIVEHWDDFQDVPAQTASGNSMFSDVYSAATGSAWSDEQEEANRQMVVWTFTELFNNRTLALLDQFFDPRYFQHNPRIPNGTTGLGQLIGSLPAGGGLRVNVSRSLADQDLVWAIQDRPGGLIQTDIFRVANGKIIEHWDILPAAPQS
ncbi:MAG TPA: nuclear transport factor 2 family protein [Chloroflexota bacterium]|nr:nuclear transport factor 2 family protein [Chloroflexota bacterium]